MPDRRRVYLDTCCFIDMVKFEVGAHLEDDRRKDAWFGKQLIQATRDGEVEAFTSVITIAECQHADGDISERVRNLFNQLLMSGQYVRLIQPTPFIAVDAQNLRWTHNIALGGADSLHIASALALKCEEFMSTDGRLAKIGNQKALSLLELKVCRPSETSCLPSKYRQLALPEHDQKDIITQH